MALCWSDRAKQKAVISFTSNRRIHGQWQTSIPSRFIDERLEPHVEVDAVDMSEAEAEFLNPSRFEQRAIGIDLINLVIQARAGNAHKAFFPENQAPKPSTPRQPATPQTVNLKQGERIFHQKFGYGRIDD